MARLNPEFKRKYMSHSLSGYDSLPHGLLTGGCEAKDRPTINKSIGLTADTCAECGKRFEHTLEHAYRRRTDGRQKLFCSYHCMRAFDKQTEGKAQKTAGVRGRPRMSAQEKLALYRKTVPEELRRADHCTGCRRCVPHCPQGIDIPKALKDIDALIEEAKNEIH